MKNSPLRIIPIRSLQHPDVKRLATREPSPSPAILDAVKSILAEVKTHGHQAVLALARRHDGLIGNLKVSQAEIDSKADKPDPEVKKALRSAIANVRRFHARQTEKSWRFTGKDGEVLGQLIRPLRRVGVYVPGGAEFIPPP